MIATRTALIDEAGSLRERGYAWAGLGGDGLAFVLSRVAAKGSWLVVADGPDRADRLVRGLRFFMGFARVEPFPGDDHRPYDGFSPDPALPQQRIRALERLDRTPDLVVVATARALMQRIPAPDARRRSTRTVSTGDRVDRDVLVAGLVATGYLTTSAADSPGRLAVRGDVVDIWPAGTRAPVRIDFFDDEIETLRRLDPRTLRPVGAGRKVTLLPAAEERLDEDALTRALGELTRMIADGSHPGGTARRRRVVEELRAGIRFSGLQDWLPALVPTVAPLEVLRDLRRVVVHPDDVVAALRDFEITATRRYELLDPDERPLVPPAERFVPAADVIAGLAGAQEVLELASDRAPDLGARGTDDLAVKGAELGPSVARLQALAAEDVRVALVVEDEARAERLLEMLAPHGVAPERAADPHTIERGKISLLTGDLPRGFVAAPAGWAFVPVQALFGARHRSSERAHVLFESGVSSIGQLKVGDPIVHRVHGVGSYRGLVRLEILSGVEQDFVKLAYRDDDVLFLPVTALEQLSLYTPASSGAEVVLDRLGGQTWARRKGKVRDHLLSMAQELLRLHGRREVAVRPAYAPAGRRSLAFEARFPHVETPDQAVAIAAVQEDLSRPYPMDRLLCGDVGFGKTEVALRAAMRVVESGRQVAVLCPTTVLAHQHNRSFRARFADDPDVKVGMLSRFTTPADTRLLLDEIASGAVHVAVGTTALLGRQVRFRDLGLIVIDEEHHFGVKQKERLKRMRTEVDILALSATPIPRTLQMALSGIREMSLIATPPPDRLAVRTSLGRWGEVRVRDAILGELERGGQVYVVHNRIETLAKLSEQVAAWVPEAKVASAHGQMAPQELEGVLVDFVERKCDVLVSTAIVESGVDLPNVNTMIVDRADHFGVAQLYQLRGRVGRGDRRATCLLCVPEDLSSDARKRIRVIVENQSLGSGFHVAAADLELRGGGNLLGAAQSGNIDQVGYETWLELLEEAVHAARGELERERIDPLIEVPVPAFLPDALVKDPQERLAWYRRISSARGEREIERTLEELESEHGEIPDVARNLGDLAIVRLACRDLGIVRCTWLKVRVVLELHPSSGVGRERIDAALRRHPKRFEVEDGPARTVSVRFTPEEANTPFRFLKWAFAQLRRDDVP